MSRLPWLLAGGLLIALGAAIWSDRPGLETEIFALGPAWEGEPTFTDVGPPRHPDPRRSRPVLVAPHPASVRWRGILRVRRPGTYELRLETDDEAYLALGDRRSETGSGNRMMSVELAPGLHRVEIGVAAGREAPRLETFWAPPGEAERRLAGEVLFTNRPGRLRRALRGPLTPPTPLGRHLLGGALLAVGLLAGRRGLRPGDRRRQGGTARRVDGLLARVGGSRGAGLLLAGLLGLVAYRVLAGAAPPRYGWVFAVTAFALAVGASALGPGARPATLAAVFLLLASQSHLFVSLGAFWPGYLAMAWVTLAVALALQRLALTKAPRLELHLLAIGAATAAAYQSVQIAGIVLLLLPAALVVDSSGAPRRLAGKLGAWSLGLAGGWLVSAAVAAGFGDGELAAAAAQCVDRELGAGVGWIELFWTGPPGWPWTAVGLRLLGLLAVGAAIAAASRRPPALQILHLMPAAYLLLLVVHRAFAPAAPLALAVIPIVPAACLLCGALFDGWGIERLARRLGSPQGLAGVSAVAVLLFALVIPFLGGRVLAAELLPPQLAASSPAAVTRTLVPGLILLAVAIASLLASRPATRLPLLLVACALAFGPGLAESRHAVASRWGAQRVALTVYPWTHFAGQLDVDSDTRIRMYRGLASSNGVGMFGSEACAEATARVFFDEPGLELAWGGPPQPGDDYALTTRPRIKKWGRRRPPGVRKRTVEDPATGLSLVDLRDLPRWERKGDRRAGEDG